MIEAGFSEKEAMAISGHKTRAVFDRYHIVSERRLKEMAGKLEVHLKAKDAEKPMVQGRTQQCYGARQRSKTPARCYDYSNRLA